MIYRVESFSPIWHFMMAHRGNHKRNWDFFEANVLKKMQKKCGATTVPSDIMVQRMTTTASGRLRKFQLIDTRDFVPFDEYHAALTLENIKEACERFYNSPTGSCDVLASDKALELESDKGFRTWVLKFYKEDAQETILSDFQLTLETHTRKQFQMDAMARYIAKALQKKAPAKFGQCFTYDTVYFSTLDSRPVTVEKYIGGKITKYINNDGTVSSSLIALGDLQQEQVEKAETLAHFSWGVG